MSRQALESGKSRRSRSSRAGPIASENGHAGDVPVVRFLADADALETIVSIRDAKPTLSREDALARKALAAASRRARSGHRVTLAASEDEELSSASSGSSDAEDGAAGTALSQLDAAELEDHAAGVRGSEMFGFQRTQRRQHLQRLAEEVRVLPSSQPSTPQRRRQRNGRDSAASTPDTHQATHDTPRSARKRRGRPPSSPQTPAKTSRNGGGGTPQTPVSRRREHEHRTPQTPANRRGESGGRTSRTPRSGGVTPLPAKTPQAVRRRIQLRLSKLKQEDIAVSDDDSDFSPLEEDDSDEEFVADKAESSSDSEQPDQDEEEEKAQRPAKKSDREVSRRAAGVRRRRAANDDGIDTGAASEQYFSLHESAGVTSNHTLSRLAEPRLSQDAMQTLLSGRGGDHAKERASLMADLELQFPRWLALLRHGFSVLLHGLGSKRELLERLRQRWLRRRTHLVVCGYHPALTTRHLLQTLLEEVLGVSAAVGRPEAQLEAVVRRFSGTGKDRLFLLVHSLDGPMLRPERTQYMLARLAQAPRVHLIATIDHINAPLIWDQQKLAQFNFIWFDATTLSPYAEETSYENSLLVRQTSELALSSLRHVFKSLTPNARGIFTLLAKHQVESAEDRSYEGLALSELYRRCREAFLVSSQVALRAQLAEFRDHRLVRSRSAYDGAELLTVPLQATLIAEFLSTCEDS